MQLRCRFLAWFEEWGKRHAGERGGEGLKSGYYQWNMPSREVQCNTNTFSWGSENSMMSSPLSGREAAELHCEYVRSWHSRQQHGFGWDCRAERGDLNPCLGGHRGQPKPREKVKGVGRFSLVMRSKAKPAGNLGLAGRTCFVWLSADDLVD